MLVSTVLAIDPGRAKCGVAVVSRDNGVLARAVVPPDDLSATLRLLAARFEAQAVVVGSGTGSGEIGDVAAEVSLPRHTLDERFSTQKARARYFQDNPPRGWRRLVPRGLLLPPVPYDDYAAVLLAEEFFRRQRLGAGSASGPSGP